MVVGAAYGVVHAASRWTAPLTPSTHVDTSPRSLPLYAGLSTLRMALAYALALSFSLVYARIAVRSRLTERLMVPVLDILQSIPILSFLPGVVLGLVAIFPHSNIGLELGAILLIFTSQAWNMAFSFHQSLLTIPKELSEASAIYQLNWWRRFTRLELPFGTIPLIWNSMMSWAGGWFFLMAAEQFTLGSHNFQLPGLGSYLQTAANAGDLGALFLGIGTLVVVIVLLDQLLWRPLLAWADRFKFEQTESAEAPRSAVLGWLRRSALLDRLRRHLLAPAGERLDRLLGNRAALPNPPALFPGKEGGETKGGERRRGGEGEPGTAGGPGRRPSWAFFKRLPAAFPEKEGADSKPPPLLPGRGERRSPNGFRAAATRLNERRSSLQAGRLAGVVIGAALVAAAALGTVAAARLLAHLSLGDWGTVAGSAGATLLRTVAALAIGVAWTVPLGVAIGMNPRWARPAQPLVQMAASIPATALFPAVLLVVLGLPGGLNLAAVALMLLGTQWYILFNVIAGAMAIPSDLREAAAIYRLRGWQRWRSLILPAIFPSLITGMLTATGGAWNASIVSEYVTFKSHTYSTIGLGSLIARSANDGNFALLLAATLAMAAVVVAANRLIWRRLSRLAEQRFRLD